MSNLSDIKLEAMKERHLISKNLIVKMGIAFLLGVALAFVITVFVISFRDRRKVNKKKKLIEAIKARNITEEA